MMESNRIHFDRALGFTLLWEGSGYVDISGDLGGPTAFGISSRAHPEIDNLAELTRNQAAKIYQRDYWTRIAGDEIASRSPAIAAALFDYAVHSGVKRSSRALQRAVGSRPDGKIGPRTLESFDTCEHSQTLERILIERSDFLIRLGTEPSQRKFLKGWIRRVVSLSLFSGTLIKETRDV